MDEKHVKNFKKWNEKKETIDKLNQPADFLFLEGEIWWAMLGVNIGQEIDGKNESFERPVLILKRFSDELAWVIPTTSTEKSSEYFYPIIHKGKTKHLLLLQMKSISSKRLLRPVFRLKEKEFSLIKEKVCNLIFSIKEIPSG
jgi:mRNA interferase MazF